MISLLNETIDWLVKLLAKTGLLRKDLDYNLLRASMVIIFLLFGYQKWFIYEAKVLIPYIGNDPFLSWMYPVFGIRGASWLIGVSEWIFGALLFLGFLEQEAGCSRGTRLDVHLRGDGHDYSVHAEWMGSSSRVPCYGRKCSFPPERRGSFGSINLPAEAGCHESLRSEWRLQAGW
jgi:Protein of unknown function, DUF417